MPSHIRRESHYPCRMPRRRILPGELIYHVLNRAAGGQSLFHQARDYQVFLDLLTGAGARSPMRLLAYCLMPTHWHLVLWPPTHGDVSSYIHGLSMCHAQWWHRTHDSAGSGAVYQGRFRAVPVQEDDHYLTVVRYVERNALRKGLVASAEDWPWGSLNRRVFLGPGPVLHESPVILPSRWIDFVNIPATPAEEESLRRSLGRGTPFGDPAWTDRTATALGLESTLRPIGRPSKSRVSTNPIDFPPESLEILGSLADVRK